MIKVPVNTKKGLKIIEVPVEKAGRFMRLHDRISEKRKKEKNVFKKIFSIIKNLFTIVNKFK